ncbi:outer membrane beta-barrel protein [Paraburkholderia sp. PREW-6R]|uniref:outer membrane protein n=1 Tax=Paraburkholderia sp. PREW-6R TaxID=3141544 RepID=UPI0031F4ED15
MNKFIRFILIASFSILSPLTQAQTAQAQIGPSDFAGPYVGFKVGTNTSNASGAISKASHTTVFPGITAGYNFDIGRFVVGAEAFADFHHGSTTFKDGGIDAKLGMPLIQFMPYARLGFTSSWPDNRLHGGLGVEYKLARQISAALEWTADSSHHDGTKRVNNSVTIGLQYHFN